MPVDVVLVGTVRVFMLATLSHRVRSATACLLSYFDAALILLQSSIEQRPSVLASESFFKRNQTITKR